MTTIAWDGKHLAADSRSTTSAGLCRQVFKLYRLPDGSLFSGGGTSQEVRAVDAWLSEQGEKPLPAVLTDFIGIHIKLDGTIWQYESMLVPWQIFEKFHAIGSGRDYALAAMYLGKTAHEAVEIAAKFDVYTGVPIDVLKL